MAEAQAYLAAIVESSDDAIIAKDLNGVIKSCNAAAEQLFGYSSAELIGRAVRILIPPERQTEEDDILARIRRGERIEHFETVRLRKDGSRIHISLTVSPVLDSSGNIIGVSKIARDITEQKRVAEEAEQQRRALSAAALERERLLEAERVARAEAERATRVKDDFVAMVSHELRTPLNAILGWTHLMMRASGDPDVMSRGLDIIARNTRMQAQLISDLLDISRIVAGKLRLDIQAVDLPSIIDDAVETVLGEARVKEIELSQQIDPDVGPVTGDPARLQQVVWNLLSNAVKFTPRHGHVVVRLRGTRTQAEISVADDGAGIRPEFLPHVFDRFHQADRSITRRFGGLGLGLAIVKDLVGMHGGSVRAESGGDGRGTTFTVVLPTDAISGRRAPDTMPAAPGADDTTSLGRLHVLVVEDEPDTREFLTRLLESYGAVVAGVGSAGEALSRFRSERPDILISDIGLPEMDGYELMQQIRHEDAGAVGGVPGIALTAYARAEDRTRALRAGYQAHIAKPVESSELIATVASLAELVDARRKER